MKTVPKALILLLLIVSDFITGVFTYNVQATAYYVDINNTNPVPPYTSWSTAATNVQTAVALTQNGDTVEVNPGVYRPKSFGTIVYGSMNSVALTNAITLLAVAGPQVTAIVGNQRCVYVGANAFLSGFSLVNGSAPNFGNTVTNQSGGGAWCEASGVISNCIFGGTNFPYANGVTPSNSNVAVYGGGDYGGTVYNSTFMGNNATLLGSAAIGANVYNCVAISNNCSGQYAPTFYGGSASNCVIIDNKGGVYYSTLYNCTVTENAEGGVAYCTNYGCVIFGNGINSANSAGGVANGIAYDCIIASNTAASGGGASSAVLYNCLLVGNQATNSAGSGGGGAYECDLYNCTVANNSSPAVGGGGITSCSAYNCIIFGNSNNPVFAPRSNYYESPNSAHTNLSYCDTYPYTPGPGIITNAPVFADPAAGDYELASNSPCINSGDNFYVSATNDLAGNSRISGATVDMGAFEYQNPSSILSYAWAQKYGLPTDGSADYEDLDGTGMPNWEKSIAELNPTNSASVLALSPPMATNNVSGITVTWQSVQYLEYYMQRSSDLVTFTSIQTNIVGQAKTTSYKDTTATYAGPYFYRVGVQ